MKSAQKLLSAVLAAAMCVGMAACHTGEDTKWVARFGEETVPAGVYIYMLQGQYYTVTSQLPTDDEGNAPKNPLKEQIDGVPVSQKIIEETRKDLNEYIAVEQKVAEMNLTVSPEELAQMDASVEPYWENYFKDTYTAMGISKESYKQFLLNGTKKELLFNAIYGEGGTEAVPETELRDKFNKDVAKVIMLSQDLSSDEDEAAKAEADKKTRDTIDQYYKELEDGVDMEEVYYQARRESAEDPDSVEKPEPGKSFTFVTRDNSTLDEKVEEAIFNAEVGKPVKVETDASVYLFVRYDVNENPDDFASRREMLTQLLRQDEFEKLLEEWGASVNAELNEKALQRYTPDKLEIGR